jgi:hypothetical protein
VNKNLYDKEIEFPEHLRKHLKICFYKVKDFNENDEGYKRNKELQNKNYITYKQLKRIKNFFDNFKGSDKEPSFVLNGGFPMKNWVNYELDFMRRNPEAVKKNKMETGMQNQFIKPHEKKDFTNVRPSQKHLSTREKYDVAVTESLKKINDLISKI